MNVKAGIVDKNVWASDLESNSCRQVLVILKEAPVSQQFNLIKHLQCGGRGNTYNNVAMWVYIFRHFGITDADMSWPTVKAKCFHREQNLKHAAVININDNYDNPKGGKRSNDHKLEDNYKEDRHQAILDKVSEIAPSIIVTGGDVVKRCLGKYSKLITLHHSDDKIISVSLISIRERSYMVFSLPHPNASRCKAGPLTQKRIYQSLISLLSRLPATLSFKEI
jgi:hypothetical protein